MHPGQLTGLSALTLQPGDFARQGVFSPPWLDWMADRTRGAGASLPAGSGILTAAMFQGNAAPLANTAHAAVGSGNLALLEYRRSSDSLHWMLQTGLIDEAQSWSGLSTVGSIYGDFAADTHYLALAAHWTPVEGIQLLGAFNTANTQLDTRLPGLLSHIGSLNQRHLELGALARSVLLPNDSLSLRWQARQSRAGQVNWRLPVGLYRRQITYQDLQFDLTGPRAPKTGVGLEVADSRTQSAYLAPGPRLRIRGISTSLRSLRGFQLPSEPLARLHDLHHARIPAPGRYCSGGVG